MCDGKVVLLGGRDVNHYPLPDVDGICLRKNPFDLQEKEFSRLNEGKYAPRL
jgi:hypothetical protein